MQIGDLVFSNTVEDELPVYATFSPENLCSDCQYIEIASIVSILYVSETNRAHVCLCLISFKNNEIILVETLKNLLK